ncbi:MAG: SsrA-binding protein SmpB [Chloroflexi bacterium]|nr:SsrA-binding protein SmpB [Chloroflexota bacterium]
MPASDSAKSGRKIVTVNRQARHDYSIEETYDAGIVLKGTEVKSIRAGKANLRDSFARVEGGEMWLHNMHVPEYTQGNRYNVEPRRSRKLLMHRREIDRLLGRTQTKGLTIIPLELFFQNGYAKVTIALGKGKQEFEKRDDLAKKEQRREIDRALCNRRKTPARETD